MNWYYLMTLPACLLLAVMALVRLADISKDHRKFFRCARIFFLSSFFAICIGTISKPFVRDWYSFGEPTYLSVWTYWSFLGVWITSQGPPFYDFLLGNHRHTAEYRALSLRQKIVAEYQALRKSFRTSRYSNYRRIGDPPINEGHSA